jgi:A/G-specific adenine glycosylase
MPSFASRLIDWQRRHGRHGLPWQGADAYGVWLSEVMLQQTQVATVIPYYQRFLAAFPTPAALAAASEEQVLAHWSGLGYYARGRNLHRAARLIAEAHQGAFPRRFEDIAQLPGIGRSTAAAICALAYRERRAILDGNVKRVLTRHCGIAGWPGDKKVEAKLWELAEARMPPALAQGDACAVYTQAIMDLGATVCARSRPNCMDCPVRSDCVAHLTHRTAQLPAPRPARAIPERQAAFLLLSHGNDILLEKRPARGVWGGLWCPPQFDSADEAMAWCAQHRLRARPDSQAERDPFTHTFTHFRLHITPVALRLTHKPGADLHAGGVWLDREEAMQGAIPAPVRRMLRAA